MPDDVVLLVPDTAPEVLFIGTVWGEGPVWLPRTGRVRWSDIPNNRIMEWDSQTGDTSVYREGIDCEFTNGRTLDLDGHVVQCSHGHRRVERDVDGVVSAIVDRVPLSDGSTVRFNSPNDVIVADDGAIWFSDPAYGILEDEREGHAGEQEYRARHVFRFDESTGALASAVTDLDQPNGLAFSPDGATLYVSDTGSNGGAIFAYDVVDGVCSGGREFARVAVGGTDGFRLDVEGRIWSSSGEGVEVLSPEGVSLLRVDLGEVCANLCFGGADGTDLFISGASSLHRLRTTTRDVRAR